MPLARGPCSGYGAPRGTSQLEYLLIREEDAADPLVGRLYARQVVSMGRPSKTRHTKNETLAPSKTPKITSIKNTQRLSHWLGRPSHIDDRQFSTAPLTVEDFEERQLPRDDYLSHSISAFVMLTRLTTVLATVLEGFYTIKRNPCVMSPEEALSHASRCQTQLNECLELQGGVLQRPNRVINGKIA